MWLLWGWAALAGTRAVSLDGDDGPWRASFEEDSARTRVVALLSPTHAGCVRGATALGALLAEHPEVVPLVVWEPVVGRDRRPGRAVRRLFPAGVRQFWDPDRSLSDAIVASALGGEQAQEGGLVWDAVLVYRPGRQWPPGEPFPPPDWWATPVLGARDALTAELAVNPSPGEVPDGGGGMR